MNTKALAAIGLFALRLGSPALASDSLTYTRPLEHPVGKFSEAGILSESEAFVLNQVFQTLFTIDSSGLVRGEMAASWKFDSTYKNLRVKLLPGLRFHDGVALSAKDVVKSLGNRPIQNLKSVWVDGGDVIFRCARPCPGLVSVLADVTYSIHRADESLGGLNGTGPFKKVSGTPSGGFVFRRSDVADGIPEIQELRAPVMDRQTAIREFISGNVDDLFHYFLSEQERRTLGGRCQWVHRLLPTYRFLMLNPNQSWLSTAESRSCILGKVDVKKLASAWAAPHLALETWFPPQTFGGQYLGKVEFSSCPESVWQRLLKSSHKSPLRMASVDGNEEFDEHIFGQIKSLGLEIKRVRARTLPEYFRLIQSKDVDLSIYRFTPGRPEVEGFLDPFLDPETSLIRSTSEVKQLQVEALRTLEVPDRSSRSLQLGQVFGQFFKLAYVLPVHQFEFNGCIASKWQEPELSELGFYMQDMKSVRLKQK